MLDYCNIPADSMTDVIGTVQETNLRFLDERLKYHWCLGKNIILCWAVHKDGVQILLAPHYYLGNFSASLNDCSPPDRLDALNGRFIRRLISGSRQLSEDEFQGTARRFQLAPEVIRLPVMLAKSNVVFDAVDQCVQRYSINYVKSRAVMLFDIVDFSLVSPFEQTSQLNSLSYSLNAASKKLLDRDININFSRTTTGDGYYVWSRDPSPEGNANLFYFMLLVLADNAISQSQAVGNTVPHIRTGFHVGSHFEFYQVEGVNPGMNSYIVGDVTIELARMLDQAQPGQVFVGEMDTWLPTSGREGAYLVAVDSQNFVDRISRRSDFLNGLEVAGEHLEFIHCYLSGETGACAGQSVRRFRITDKHGLCRDVYNLRINIRTSIGRSLILGTTARDSQKQQVAGLASMSWSRAKPTTTAGRRDS